VTPVLRRLGGARDEQAAVACGIRARRRRLRIDWRLLGGVLRLAPQGERAHASEAAPVDAMGALRTLTDEEAEGQLAPELASLRRTDAYGD